MQQKQQRKAAVQNQKQTPTKTTKKLTTAEEVHLRKVTLYFVIALCSTSEIASIAAYFLTRSIEAAAIFQLTALPSLFKILNFLYPGPDPDNSLFLMIIRTLKPH